MSEILVFLLGSALILWLSRKPLRQPGRHGFYRFFAWEAILGLIVLNHGVWGNDPYSAHQLASWLLMVLSILLVQQGYSHLTQHGRANKQREDQALYEFEKTTTLVTSGIYGYIRHPMYASLLALAWGAYFQDPSWLGTGIAVLCSYFLLLTAKADEEECLAYFGPAYADYMRQTQRFIPGLF
jgi:protein-S-isoprenylcysteine O-methyltransferase Ste14